MTTIKRKAIDSTIESRILTGLIVSKPYIYEVYPAIDLGYFEHSYIQQVAKWVLEYYEQYGDAPANHIQDIFETKKFNLKEGEPELVESLLNDIARRHNGSSAINVEYLARQTRQYYKKRELD